MVKEMKKSGVPGEVPEIFRTDASPDNTAEKRIVLTIAILAGFITPFDGSAVNIALPTIGAEFHMNAIALSWVATAYLLSSAVFLVPFGKIADIYGRKKVFLYGISIFSLASLAMTMVPSTEILIGIRIVQGLGSAMIFGTGVAIVTSVFPPGERGKALGIYITAVYLGLSLGPFLGGLMTQYLGWRSIFFVNVPIGIMAVILILWKLKGEWAECRGEKFDLTGSVIYGAAVVAVMYGFSTLPDFKGAAFIAAGILGVIGFALYEMRIPSPVLDIRLLTKNRIFALSNLAALINYSATFAVTFLLSLDLQYTKGFTPEHAGFILIAQPVVQAMVSPIAGRLSDRIEPRIVASAGMALTAVGLFFLIFLTETTPLWHLVLILLLLGAGFGLFSSPNTNAIMSSVDKRFYGVASGMNGTMRLLGQMLSMGIAMMIFAVVIGPVEITPEYHSQFVSSLHYAFILFTIFCIIGVFASLVRGKTSSVVRTGIPEAGKKTVR
ncbi:MFS transporter [Methanosarcina sp. 2.H.T.1A.6]|uniref:MFS transporter n=1 Tax=unclassified Methanosarcina TaxID=2644672 RepID=UPI00062110AD|nr:MULTISPECIES: MFS transporter [unclassified Methanosarcina]KKG15866.1 MFS transporter [Methanosarcina sp. 2.H.T.1A.15]KKG16686.1 MFS transporter [Methanosarcina sp. 2.H.T.1A.3]KKG22853.1 MFS transporter [Methanosarcina sp. 2.H.T.1A.6]KKG24416.1 MFS transporter [Methanosarcina sp. 2.H.T.1A.8]